VTEQRLETGIYAYLRLALPPDAFVTSVDHARKQSERSGLRQKARGVRAGIPDMLIIYRGEIFWLEVKTQSGSLTESQRALHAKLADGGVDAGRPLASPAGLMRLKLSRINLRRLQPDPLRHVL